MSAGRTLACVGRLSRTRGYRFARRCSRCRDWMSGRDRVAHDAGATIEGVDLISHGLCERCGRKEGDLPPAA